MDTTMAHKIEQIMKVRHYSTRTELVREALRDKIDAFEKQEALARLDKIFGSSPRRTTDTALRVAREKAWKEVEKRYLE